ncbi:ABC transporter ATP-binding protein [Afipia sp. P52-10]|uniref:ABC transporter ATP-binding protein n=1 Tax=Afipia sp. P52-10 TaxID=1429916 RepID=UPI00055098A7|nr:ABC transporter ATP-binding protein [Afipia sp. P52-10]
MSDTRVTDKPLEQDPHGTALLIRRLIKEQGVAYWRRYALAFILMSVAAAATALSTYLLKDVVNAAYQERNFNLILTLSLGIAAIFIVRGAATYGQSVILSKIANAILADNQRRLFAKLMRENVGFYSDRHSSEFLARMTIGASAIAQLLNMLITSVGRDLLTLIGLLVVMIVQDPVMALIGLLVAPPALLVLRKLIRRIRGLAGNQFTGQANIQETMLEALQGIRTVKAFTLEGAMQQRIDANIDAVQASANKMARVSHRSSPLMETLGGLAICLTLVYSGYRIVETGATPGQFLSFLAAFLLAYEPAKRLAKLNLDLNAALIGARKLLEIVDSPSSEPDDGDKPALRLRDARVEFCDVTFAYRPGETVLDHMNLVAEPGKVTALVGPSGGGKSTVLNLMLRLYEVAEGAILVDGQTIADVSRQSLRLQTAYVGQDVFLFRDTIRENIAFGRPGASQADIIAAATAACAHDFIMGFPQGYDTPVGEHGAQLSGGQRQRIAIARALVKNAPIILLDEATAALDSESERQVQEAIEHLCHGRTTLVIAHRLNTIMHADTIHVIENGRVVETGNHDDLLRRNGRYASFFRLQYRDSRPLALASGNG